MNWIKINNRDSKTFPKINIPVLVAIQGYETKSIRYAVMEKVKESDVDWRFDDGEKHKGSELDYAWDVIAWCPISKIKPTK